MLRKCTDEDISDEECKNVINPLVNKGANVQVVAKYLGHTKVEETLKTYTHLYKNALTDITSLIYDMNEEQNNDFLTH